MQLNRIIALVLVIVCFVAAATGISRQQANKLVKIDALESAGTPRLELITLEGVINGSRAATGALAVRDRLVKLKDEENVKGVLISINSPGGTVGTSKELFEAIRELREVKPVYSSMLDVAASGGYYAASATTKIYANAGTLTGSIGVILSGLNVQELFDRIGVQAQVIKTGPYKDIFSPYREISEPEQKLLQDLLQDTYRQFIEDVHVGRDMDLEAVRTLADGRIYTGKQAVDNGLVDQLGTYEEAVEDLRKAAREKFNLDESVELPIRSGFTSFDLFIDQLFGRLPFNVNFSIPFLPGLGNNLARNTLPIDRFSSSWQQGDRGLTINDPPILLMPIWYQ
ncbi:signal peptide peptidase SppA, 36K type [Thalassoporum mexicanum PCC 7367]|uniref:signal peptide peptidase SppA n=1 Tax=Thalassoporum mexicanum TaxID=3457544 RepID=UPI00029FB87B|nr:signal peptide peptidase SppA [Pseudanabaena sp. PCC 7367]AFY70567.1 signal peptide peptidase SppA, 36K type [Pseudanabaena sp. PCC 7367]